MVTIELPITIAYKKRNFQFVNFLDDSPFQYLFGKVVFNWVGVPNFWEEQVENRAKTRKNPISLGLEGDFSICP